MSADTPAPVVAASASALPTAPADGVPRLAYEALGADLQGFLAPTVERLGYFGEMFAVMAHVPDAIPRFMAYTQAVKAPLADAENEVLALATCALLGARYERVQHERLALKLGLSHAWVAAAAGWPGADPTVLSASERALRALSLAVAGRAGHDCAREVAEVARLLGAQQTAAALLQVARFTAIAQVCNALALALPVPSPLEEGEP